MMRFFHRPPDFVIGGDNPYLHRWWVIPRNRWFNIYLHHILRDDEDRALHDHPWVNCSILLRGRYSEVVPITTPDQVDLCQILFRRTGTPYFRRAIQAHRIVLEKDDLGQPKPVWSLFITGPIIRNWGFWCERGWKQWEDFVAPHDKGAVGRGCGD